MCASFASRRRAPPPPETAAWSSPRAIRELGARLGDPVVVDVRRADASGGGDDDAWTWTFLATVAPASVQQGTLASDAPSASDDAAVLDPSVRLPSFPGAPPPSARVDAGDAPLEARVRALDARPAPCVTLRVRARDRDPTPVAAESLRRLLQHRVLAPGAAVHLARDDTPTADPNRNADPSSQSNHLAPPIVVHSVDPPDATCVRVTPATRASSSSTTTTIDWTTAAPFPSRPRRARFSPARMTSSTGSAKDRGPSRTPTTLARSARGFPRAFSSTARRGWARRRPCSRWRLRLARRRTRSPPGTCSDRTPETPMARLRAAFRAAERDTARGTPAVLIIDEIDAVCPARGADAGLHGSRVVAQLLTLMDDGADEDRDGTETSGRDAERGRTVGRTRRRERRGRRVRPTVAATTNRPNALDPALRRPGRFDVEIEVPLPSAEQRAAIVALHSRSLPLATDVNLAVVARDASG